MIAASAIETHWFPFGMPGPNARALAGAYGYTPMPCHDDAAPRQAFARGGRVKITPLSQPDYRPEAIRRFFPGEGGASHGMVRT